MIEKPVFYTEDLAVGYRGKVLIGEINISVSRGKILTLIGPNGAGKSTILKTAAKQLDSISGAVYIDGNDISAVKGKILAKKISVLMTERIDPELMTCRNIVESGRYPYTGQMGILSAADHERVEEAMQITSVTEIGESYFNCVSDGQRQRVMLARAICQEPELLILDEPTSFLDLRHKLELLNILKKLVREKNIAVIMSLHELDMAQRISDFVICIKNNRVDRCGVPDEIFESDYISALYEIPRGSYNAYCGSAELMRCEGTPQVFVIAGGGTGCSVFRKLQRENIPFAAGIIYENDIDYLVAKSLASEVIFAPALEPMDKSLTERAIAIMDSCKKVICCLKNFGTLNYENKILLEYAKQHNYL